MWIMYQLDYSLKHDSMYTAMKKPIIAMFQFQNKSLIGQCDSSKKSVDPNLLFPQPIT